MCYRLSEVALFTMSWHRFVWVVWAMLFSMGACGSNQAPSKGIQKRQATGAETLLSLVPKGVSALLEIDLKRVRQTEFFTPLMNNLVGQVDGQPMDAMAQGDALVIASYGVGAKAERLILIKDDASEKHLGQPVAPGVWGKASPTILDEVQATKAQGAGSIQNDSSMMTLRAESMPKKSTGAILRFLAHLNFDERVSLSKRFGWHDVPTKVSLWGDIIDDLAVICRLETGSVASAISLSKEIAIQKTRWGRSREIRRLGLRSEIANMNTRVDGHNVEIVFVIGPKRLQKLLKRLGESWGAQT